MPKHLSELFFIESFFPHKEWIYEPCRFYISPDIIYTPDFFDKKRNCFIEVSSSIACYKNGSKKYNLFRDKFSPLCLETRWFNGEMIILDKKGNPINFPFSDHQNLIIFKREANEKREKEYEEINEAMDYGEKMGLIKKNRAINVTALLLEYRKQKSHE